MAKARNFNELRNKLPAVSRASIDARVKATLHELALDELRAARELNRCSPRRVHTSTVKKSAATISYQCRVRNSFQVVLLGPLRRRLAAVPLQNLSDRAAGNLVPQIGHCPLDAPIAPIPVLFGHSNHPSLDLVGGARSPRSALATAVVFLSDQFAMPC